MPPGPVPEPLVPGDNSPAIGFVADLVLEVGVGSRRTRAHLSGGPGDLMLDVDDPAVLLRSLPKGVRIYRLPAGGALNLLSDTTVRVRSGGSELGSVRFPRDRRVVVRPAAAGLLVAGRQVLSWRPVRIAGGLLAAALVALRVRSVRHRTADQLQ